MDGARSASTLIQTEFVESNPTISPDGGWIAYDSDASGRIEIYVQRFPMLGDRQVVSTNGGMQPLWSPDGRELFYRSVDGREVLAVPIDRRSIFASGTPEVLFEGPYPASGRYDLDPDGPRFVMVKEDSVASGGATGLVLVRNWFEELRERVPVP